MSTIELLIALLVPKKRIHSRQETYYRVCNLCYNSVSWKVKYCLMESEAHKQTFTLIATTLALEMPQKQIIIQSSLLFACFLIFGHSFPISLVRQSCESSTSMRNTIWCFLQAEACSRRGSNTRGSSSARLLWTVGDLLQRFCGGLQTKETRL